MEMKQNNALYYPTIEFSNYEWLWSAALLWDKIYRIVPKSYILEEPDNIKALVADGSIGIPLHPDAYINEVANKFIEDRDNNGWDAAALTVSDPENEDYVRLHPDKVDVKLKKMLIAKGAFNDGTWYHVPTDFGGLYMTYLAKEISERNNLQLISDFPAAWTGATYFKYDGQIDPYVLAEECPLSLANLMIRDFLPKNILSITPAEIIKFRNKRKHERQRFLNSIKNAAMELANCEDPKVVSDMIEDIKNDINESLSQYKKSMDILNVAGWTGLTSLGFACFKKISNSFLVGGSPLSMSILSAGGIAIGIIAGIYKLREEHRKLSLESDYSYLLHLDREWDGWGRDLSYNGYLWRQIEEFIND